MAVDPSAVLLIQFARKPREGEVKTRMMPQLSAAQACQLHTQLLTWTCDALLASGAGDVQLCVTELDHPVFDSCLRRGVASLSLQCQGDLGERMYAAIRAGLTRYAKVILVGSDCPAIDSAYINRAVEALDSNQVVLGPAMDGGYVLIGAAVIKESLFAGMAWGTDSVYQQTVNALDEAGLVWRALESLADIDRPEDIPLWDAIRLGH